MVGLGWQPGAVLGLSVHEQVKSAAAAESQGAHGGREAPKECAGEGCDCAT